MPKNGNGVFEIDGMTFRLWVKELKRSFKVTDTDNSGRLKDYSMYRDIAGTFYNYTLTLDPDRSNRADYDSFMRSCQRRKPLIIWCFHMARWTLEVRSVCNQRR
ncbi:MAG: hypothetical protein ACLR8P_14010 [Clostridium fessum]